MEIKRSYDRLISTMGFPIPVRWHLYIESGPRALAVWTLILQWRHNERNGVSNHQPHHCLLNHLFRNRSKKTTKLPVTGLCVGNSPLTGEFPAQMASNMENVSIWWPHRDLVRPEYSGLSARGNKCVVTPVDDTTVFYSKIKWSSNCYCAWFQSNYNAL